MSKDQAIGGTILITCFLMAIFYVITLFYPQWLAVVGLQLAGVSVQFWIIAVPVFIAFVAVLGIGAWIGWIMATTPSPKPFEDIVSETEKEKEQEKT